MGGNGSSCGRSAGPGVELMQPGNGKEENTYEQRISNLEATTYAQMKIEGPKDGDEPTDWLTPKKRKFKLEANVFGSFALACAKTRKGQRGWTHTLFAGILVLVCLYTQTAFAMVMIPAISGDELKGKWNSTQGNIFEGWRADEQAGGEKDKTGAIWATWACKGQDWSWPESQIDSYKKYAAKVESVLFTWSDFTKGEMFGVLALFLWAGTVLQALRGWADYVTILFLDGGVTTPHYSLGTNPAVKMTVVLIGFARLSVSLLLAWHGATFLCHTDNLKDFILNSVALGFIYDCPAFLYNAFASNDEKTNMEDHNEDMFVYIPDIIWSNSGTMSVFLGVVIVIGSYIKWLSPFNIALIDNVFWKLCPP